MVESAMSGKSESNEKLGGLIDLSMPVYTNYNQLQVDSVLSGGMLFYTVLLEFPNPAYNRFAVYDAELNLRLLDYSLNGNLNSEYLEFSDFGFYGVSENFISKDLLYLERLRLYYLGKDTTSLALKTFRAYSSPAGYMEREISEYNESMIIFNNSAEPDSRTMARVDTFIFNDIFYRFITRENTFDTLIRKKIENFSTEKKKPEITDPGSLALSLENTGAVDPVLFNNSYNLRLFGNLLLYMPSDWSAKQDGRIAEGLVTETSGIRIENPSHSGGFNIIQLEENESFDLYFSYPFEETQQTNFTMEYTAPIISGGRVNQYFGLHCAGSKYLIVLTASEQVFNSQRHDFDYIIRSFGVDCN